MAKAIFHRLFNFSDPKAGRSWRIRPSEKAQSFPQRVIDAAVEAGAAEIPSSGTTPAKADKSEG